MAKGENIFKRKDGRWEARYVKGRDSFGKIKYGYCYGRTYKEAKDKANRERAEMVLGRSGLDPQRGERFELYCEEWFECRKSRFKDPTCVKYRTILEKHIKPRLGALPPGELNDLRVKLFTNELLFDEKLAPKTVKDILVVLGSILGHMEKHLAGGFLKPEIIYPKEIKREMRVLTREEQNRFAAYLSENMDDCKFGVLLALLTGMRIGELCALRWEDISLEEKTVTIASTMQRLKDLELGSERKTKILIGSPKSYRSSRTIPLSDNAAELCRRMRPELSRAFILTGTERYMEPRSLQYRLKRYTAACALEGVHFHTLRHTFATRCVEVGFEIKSLSEILGHANTSITLDRYVHSSMELKRENMKKLSSVGL